MADSELEFEHVPTQPDTLTPSSRKGPSHTASPTRIARIGQLLDDADTIMYAIVGISLLLGAIFALIYTFWSFGVQVFFALPQTAINSQPALFATAIIEFVSGLLLVIIIVEVLATIIHYVKSHETSLRPFLFIGIVSATRSILVVSARLAIVTGTQAHANILDSMLELGVSGLLILGLAITLRILGNSGTADLTNE